MNSAASGAEGVIAAAAIHGKGPADFGKVKVPTFYMCGEKDTTVRCSAVIKGYDQTPKALWGKNVFAELKGADHLEVQKPLPGGRWDYYIAQFLLCYLNTDSAACDNIYGKSRDSLCGGGLMVECNHAGPQAA